MTCVSTNGYIRSWVEGLMDFHEPNTGTSLVTVLFCNRVNIYLDVEST